MYKLHSLQHPDWHRTGTSYCYFCIFEIIHHDSVIFSKTYPSFLTVKEGSTSHPDPPQERGRKPPSGAQNRYAIRLADHQRSSPYCAVWDRLKLFYVSLSFSKGHYH